MHYLCGAVPLMFSRRLVTMLLDVRWLKYLLKRSGRR